MLLKAVNGLIDPAARRRAAERLAVEVGAESFLILIPDREVGILRPAPGFPPTLPGGQTWRLFFDQCAHGEEIDSTVAFPTFDKMTTIQAFVTENGAVLALVGGSLSVSPKALSEAYPFLAPLMIAESEALAAKGVAQAALEAEKHAAGLTEALDRSRKDLAGKGHALQVALAESARLNAELRNLNATLEQRVSLEINERLKAEAFTPASPEDGGYRSINGWRCARFQ